MSKNFNSNKTKRIAKKWLSLIAVFALGAICMSFASPLFAKKDLNPDNLLKFDNYFEKTIATKETDKGLKINWKDDGSIVLNGKHADDSISNESYYELSFTSVDLTPGEYTFSANNKNCGKDSYGLYISYGSEKKFYQGSDITFTVAEDCTASVGIFVKNNTYILYGELFPVLQSGDTQSFYKAEK